MTAPLAFVDCETTGLDPERHEIWEVALILRDSEGVEVERTWQLPVDLGRADPMALDVGQFHERRWDAAYNERWMPTDEQEKQASYVVQGAENPRRVVPSGRMDDWAARFAELTHGAHLVGAVVSFDADRLARLLRRHHACPGWHYHLVDVEALAVGYLSALAPWRHTGDDGVTSDVEFGWQPPWRSETLSRELGVDPEAYEKHTALGDARWARDLYDAVMIRHRVVLADTADDDKPSPKMADGSEPFGWDDVPAGPGGQS